MNKMLTSLAALSLLTALGASQPALAMGFRLFSSPARVAERLERESFARVLGTKDFKAFVDARYGCHFEAHGGQPTAEDRQREAELEARYGVNFIAAQVASTAARIVAVPVAVVQAARDRLGSPESSLVIKVMDGRPYLGVSTGPYAPLNAAATALADQERPVLTEAHFRTR